MDRFENREVGEQPKGFSRKAGSELQIVQPCRQDGGDRVRTSPGAQVVRRDVAVGNDAAKIAERGLPEGMFVSDAPELTGDPSEDDDLRMPHRAGRLLIHSAVSRGKSRVRDANWLAEGETGEDEGKDFVGCL